MNGYLVKQENIGNLFQSVQLNIKNPHFLIMQGKVTQVVNMKPLEILGLLEEGAGTSIYEMKKIDALKTIKKKENKLDEINKILMEEISPQLEKLLKDKQTFLTWKSRENEIQRLTKVLIAYEYFSLDKGLNNRTNEIIQFKVQQENFINELSDLKDKIENIKQQIEIVSSKFGSESNNSMKEMDTSINKIVSEKKNLIKQKEIVKKNLEVNLQEINKKETEIDLLNNQCESSNRQKKDLISNLEIIEKEYETKLNYLRDLERNIENATTGKSNDISKELFNIQKLIIDAKSNINKTKTEKNKLKYNIKFISDELEQKKENLSNFAKNFVNLKKNMDELLKKKNDCQIDLDKLDFKPSSIENIHKQIKENEIEVLYF